MDFLYVVFFIILVVLLVVYNNRLAEKIESLERVIIDLHYLVEQVKKGQQEQKIIKDIAKETEKAPEFPKPPPVVSQPFASPPQPAPVSEITKPFVPSPEKPVEVESTNQVIKDPLSQIRHSSGSIPPPKRYIAKPEPSFFERYPDLEKFIGENLVNKIGIAILVLAIGFFVKYAIDQNWVGPSGRVAIGIAAGGILVGIAHRLRKNYKAFSSVLVGGGIAVFYFTITLAFHQFHLFSQTVSFFILIVITAFAVALSLLYDRQELAVIALLGGMSSPFMVSTGHANYDALFIYYIILNTGLLFIAYFKAWRLLNILSFALTVLVLAGLIFTLPDRAAGTVFLYSSILYLVFFLINVANNIKENKAFISSDFTILLTNTALYFGAGLYLMHLMNEDQFRGLFCAGIGALNLIFSFFLFRTKKADSNILYLLIGITLTFLSLTAPVQLHGHYITLFWSAECVLLYWLFIKSKIKLMQWASLIVWVAMFSSLLLDWLQLYGTEPHGIIGIIANKGFITTVFSSICSFLLFILVNKAEKDVRLFPPVLFKIVALIFLFSSGALEINQQFITRFPDTGLNFLYLTLYLPAFVFVFSSIGRKLSTLALGWETEAVLYAISIFIYLLLSQQYFDVQADILVGHRIAGTQFMAHWLADVFIVLLFVRSIQVIRNNFGTLVKPAAWILTGAGVVFLSLEICLASNSIFYTQRAGLESIQNIYIKTGLPVLWGIVSFVLMWTGMRNKTRLLRIISLTLFTLTLVKLFTYDIENIPAGGKIAAFFCLGVLLLIISFMYQKVKVIITDDKAKTEE